MAVASINAPGVDTVRGKVSEHYVGHEWVEEHSYSRIDETCRGGKELIYYDIVIIE